MAGTGTRDRSRAKPRIAKPAKPGGKPTLRTIAALTGLNITTISRALHNAPELNRDTRQRVQRIAAEIGYVPDRTALRLKTGRTHVISLILDPHDEILGFGKSMVSGITAALHDSSYHLIITASPPGVAPLEPIRYLLHNKAADGVIFSRTEPDDARVKLLLEADFPFVSHGRTAIAQPHPFVDYDNAAFAQHAALRLSAKGCRRAAIILPPMRFTFGTHLHEGFLRAVAASGMAGEILEGVTLDSPPDAIRQATTRRLGQMAPPDGFVCGGDASALAVMAGLTDAGRIIGRDVQVVAKQTSGVFSLVRPRVDTIFEDTALAGERMGELLLRRIRGEPPETLQLVQSPEVWF